MLKYVGLQNNPENITQDISLAIKEMKVLSSGKIEGVRYPTRYMEANNVTISDAETMHKCLKITRKYISRNSTLPTMELTVCGETILVNNENPKLIQLLSEEITVKNTITVERPTKPRKNVDFVKYRMSIMLPESRGLYFIKMTYLSLIHI